LKTTLAVVMADISEPTADNDGQSQTLVQSTIYHSSDSGTMVWESEGFRHTLVQESEGLFHISGSSSLGFAGNMGTRHVDSGSDDSEVDIAAIINYSGRTRFLPGYTTLTANNSCYCRRATESDDSSAGVGPRVGPEEGDSDASDVPDLLEGGIPGLVEDSSLVYVPRNIVTFRMSPEGTIITSAGGRARVALSDDVSDTSDVPDLLEGGIPGLVEDSSVVDDVARNIDTLRMRFDGAISILKVGAAYGSHKDGDATLM
jgi:hypothetical protein